MHEDSKANIASHIKALELAECKLAECESDLRQALAEVADVSAETKSLLRMWRDLEAESA